MKIRNTTQSEIEDALTEVNKMFDGNIKFKRFDPDGKTRSGDPKHIVTLTVHDSSKAGGRLSRSGRRVAAACWHVHGEFFDALPPDCKIVVDYTGGRRVITPGDPWVDSNIGSRMWPFYYSEACDCSMNLY